MVSRYYFPQLRQQRQLLLHPSGTTPPTPTALWWPAERYYPKNRIRRGYGHLSNRQALELFTAHKPPFMSHLLLAHLSKDKNGPRLVRALFTAHASGTEIVVASRFKETPVYQVRAGELPERPQPAPTGQLSLFCEDLVLLHPHRLLKLLPGYPSAGPSGSLSLWVTPCLIASI